MYLRNFRHIVIQAYYVRTTKITVILVSVIISLLREDITLCKRKFAYSFHRNSDMNFGKYYFTNAILKNSTTSSNLTFITILNNATKAFSRFMCIFSYADFAVLFNNLACLDTSYWIMFFELETYIMLWDSQAFAESPTLDSLFHLTLFWFHLVSPTILHQVLDP